MKEREMRIKTTKVFKVNGNLVVAEDIIKAIQIYQEDQPLKEISKVELITNDGGLTSGALAEEFYL